jgi:hypothetical protein
MIGGLESRQGLGIFLFTTASRPALGPIQPPIQWAPGALSSGRGVKQTTHLHLVPRSRMSGATPPLPQYAFIAWCSVKAQRRLHLYLRKTGCDGMDYIQFGQECVQQRSFVITAMKLQSAHPSKFLNSGITFHTVPLIMDFFTTSCQTKTCSRCTN